MEWLDEEKRKKLAEMYPPEKLKGLSADQLLDLVEPAPQNSQVLIGPLAEVVSIKIKMNEDSDVEHKVFGTIQITDGKGNIFQVYKREDDNPETIVGGGALTLTVPKHYIIIPSNAIQVDVNLKDGDNDDDDEIVKGVFNWNCMTKAGYDEINTVEFKGKCGSAVLDYVTFFYAVIARVDMKLMKRGGALERSPVKIYGEIIARHAPNLSSILFNKKEHDSVLVEYRSYIELSRHVFIVPASSSLEIYAKLFDGDTHEQIVEGTVEYNALRYSCSQEFVQGQEETVLEVMFTRKHTFMQRVQTQNLLHRRRSSTMRINRNLQSPYGIKLFEVYSVLIGGGNGEDINIWGSIYILGDDGTKFASLFDRDKGSCHQLLPYQTLPLTSYTKCFAMLWFYVSVRIRDSSDRFISCGELAFQDNDFDKYKSLFNTLFLCSLIRGTGGYYAIIHYSIFDAGVQAMVRVHLCKKNSTTNYVKVGGSICAQYSSFDYSVPYHKEYYTKRLFSRKSTEPWVCCPSSMELCESSVMVPQCSALLVDVDLEVAEKGDDKIDESFHGILEFPLDIDTLNGCETVMDQIECSSYVVRVHVEWRPVYY